MSDLYYRWFPGDYLRDTACLSNNEDLFYRRLLDHYYMQGPPPVSGERIYRIVRATSPDEHKAVDFVLKTHFVRCGDVYRNKKADEEISGRTLYLEKQREKSALGVRARQKSLFDNPEDNPRVNPEDNPRVDPAVNPPSPSPSPSTSPLPSPSPKEALSPSAPSPDNGPIPYKAIVEYLNGKVGSHFHHATPKYRKMIKARVAEGFSFPDFIQVIDRKAQEWGGDPKMAQYLRPQTLFSGNMDSYLNGAENISGKISQAGGRSASALSRWVAKGETDGKKELKGEGSV